VQRAEDRLRYERYDLDAQPPRRAESYLTTNTWSDETFSLDAAARADIQRRLAEPALAAQLHSAGYLEVSATGSGIVNSAGLFAYQPETRAEYSVTVRNPRGTASGWAGADDRDWRKIDAERLSRVALEKCQRSADPVAIEPGRYTVILEPQAVAELMLPLVRSLTRMSAEAGVGPWADKSPRSEGAAAAREPGADAAEELGRSKIGQKVLDDRITIGADPADPDAAIVPFWADGTPHRAVKWIEDGVLRELAYDRFYALRALNRSDPLNNSQAFRMSGGQASVDEMIADTARGLLITRLVNVRQVDGDTLLCTGTTSDGVWLIERGRITTPVKNFRFRESPLYAFNNLELLGTPVRVLQRMPTIVPPAKIRDFSLTSLADAV
jgi:predicted Zn-dependent protease